MLWRPLPFVVLCAATLVGAGSCDRSGPDPAVVRYATSRPAGVPPPQPELAPATSAGPDLVSQPPGAGRPSVEGPFPMAQVQGKEVVLPDGLKYIEIKEGTGDSPRPGQNAFVDYTGWLTNGTMFDTSRTNGLPFHFKVSMGAVIKGWDEGVATMKVGGKRRLIIPPDLGYGNEAKDTIPAGSTLIFDIDLLAVGN